MSTSDITFTALPSFEISTGLCLVTGQNIGFFSMATKGLNLFSFESAKCRVN